MSFLEQFVAGRPFYSSTENAFAQNIAVQEDDKFPAYSTSLFYPPVHVLSFLFLNSILPGGACTVRKMRPPRISLCKRTIKMPGTVPLCFSLLYEYMFLVSFLEQFVAGRPFYSSKESASTPNFAVQEDDKHAAYSTSLFFPPVHVCCVFS